MTTDNPYRSLPRVDDLAERGALQATGASASLRVEAARAAIAAARERIAAGEPAPTPQAIEADAAARARDLATPTLRRVINATGILVHTNLGRAPLAPEAVAEALRYCNLELDLPSGRRGKRRVHCEELLTALSGAEAAFVVNNNAAAVVLMLGALCEGREVIVSRGEQIEIGGSFRIPEIMRTSGAVLREVGTTNRTWARDYEAAIGESTAAILKVHPSNYRVTGFVHTPTTAELAEVARRRGIPLLHDLGAATFGPLPAAIRSDTDPAAELAAGVDVLCFSGDKILGGPQAGLLLGRRDLVDRIARHPLARAFRADKLTLAALSWTLLAYRSGRPEQIPMQRMLHAPLPELRARAERLAERLRGLDDAHQAAAQVSARVVACEDAVGGGTHPGETFPGVAVELGGSPGRVAAAAAALRRGTPPVVAVVRDDRLVVHLRSVDPAEDDALAAALRAAFGA